ncbi:Baeyer-Villiger monooxygenase [Nymphon striatum]|nr:Baeyer-Villiger monooxygenase [Nymphon striatum]
MHDIIRRGDSAIAASPAERNAVFTDAWNAGGFQFWFGTFADVGMNMDANRLAYEYWRDNTRARLDDPRVAELLAPMEQPYAFGAKRPSLEQDFYEAFNQPNVELVDLKTTPITEITETGVRCGDDHYELDVLGARHRLRRQHRRVDADRCTGNRRRQSGRAVVRRCRHHHGHRVERLPQHALPVRASEPGGLLQWPDVCRVAEHLGRRPARAHAGAGYTARRGDTMAIAEDLLRWEPDLASRTVDRDRIRDIAFTPMGTRLRNELITRTYGDISDAFDELLGRDDVTWAGFGQWASNTVGGFLQLPIPGLGRIIGRAFADGNRDVFADIARAHVLFLETVGAAFRDGEDLDAAWTVCEELLKEQLFDPPGRPGGTPDSFDDTWLSTVDPRLPTRDETPRNGLLIVGMRAYYRALSAETRDENVLARQPGAPLRRRKPVRRVRALRGRRSRCDLLERSQGPHGVHHEPVRRTSAFVGLA